MTITQHIEGGTMADAEFKARENRARRAALRQRLRLEKSKWRDPRAIDFGTYRLVDEDTNEVVVSKPGKGRYGLTLDEVEQALDRRVADGGQA